MLREMDILEDWAAIRKVNLEVFNQKFFFLYESCIYFVVFQLQLPVCFPLKKLCAIT